MKKFLLTLMIISGVTVVLAQPEAGSLFIGGDLGFSTLREKDKTGGTVYREQNISMITVLPKAGYFLSERLAVGLQTGIVSRVNKPDDATYEKETNVIFVIQPFGRFYFTTGTGGIFAEANVGLGAGKARTVYPDRIDENNLTSLSFTAGPGVYYYITPNVAIEAQFGLIGFTTDIQKSGDVKFIDNQFIIEAFPASISFGLSITL